jgi:multicomponent Na+:H+ antiporter subunit B
MRRDVILRVGVKLILPFILVFALYVHFHGDFGPGGGFQAGVIAAAIVILYAMIFGADAARRIAPQALIERLVPLGVLIYASAGLPALFVGHRFLDYSVLSHDPVHGHELGILWIETGVIVTVASTMIAIFYAFSGRGRS